LERSVDWVGLFLRLDGRIGRKAFWIGFGVVLAGLLLADVAARGVGAASLLLLVLLYPLIAVLVKRLHDRGRSGWWAAVVASPLAVGVLAAAVARIVGLGEEGIVGAATGGIWVAVWVLAGLAVVELGFRRGRPGYTEHGPPPLA
jgi:uncharacterized membrane protein YhaH (DUF805 family)